MGANGGSTRVPRAKKFIFFKVVTRPLGMLKQVFFVCFEPVMTLFGPWKIPKCLENGPFWDHEWVKNGSKMCCSKSDLGPFAMLKQVFLACLEDMVTRFGPWTIPKCLENGPLLDPKWVKNGLKALFCKTHPRPLGMPRQVFLAHFEPIGTSFGPRKISISLEIGPVWEQKWVKMGQKRVSPKVTLDHWGCKNKCFEPILSHFRPISIPSASCMHQVLPFAVILELCGGATYSLGEGCR